jgi:hypothetical protein
MSTRFLFKVAYPSITSPDNCAIEKPPAKAPPAPVWIDYKRLEVGERLPVGVADDVAAGYLVDTPWCGETVGCVGHFGGAFFSV